MQAELVSEVVQANSAVVYEFAKELANLPQWASGLAAGIERRGERWFSQSPMGEVEIVMAADNPFGVLDHDVILPDGTSVHNAFRVTPAGTDSVLSFVVLRMPGTSEDAFQSDVTHVREDLRALGRLLETRR